MYVMRKEMEDISERDWNSFKLMIVANNPGQAKEILEVLEKPQDEQVEWVNPDGTYDVFSADETNFALQQMREFGFSFFDED